MPVANEVKVRFTDAEMARLKMRAKRDQTTLAGLLRAGIGLQPAARGGRRQGAGRKKNTAEATVS